MRTQTVRVIGRAWWTLTTADQVRVVRSLDFGVTLRDASLNKLLRAMESVAAVLLSERFRSGDLRHFLRQRGWSLADPIDPRAGDPTFRVPLALETGGAPDVADGSGAWAAEVNRLVEQLNHCIARNPHVPSRLRDQAHALMQLAPSGPEAGNELTKACVMRIRRDQSASARRPEGP